MSKERVAALCRQWGISYEARRLPAVDDGGIYRGDEATELTLSRPGTAPLVTIVYVNHGDRPLALWALSHLVELLDDGRHPTYEAWLFEGSPPACPQQALKTQHEHMLHTHYHQFARPRYQRALSFFSAEEIEALALAF